MLRKFAACKDKERGDEYFDVEFSGFVVDEYFDLVVMVVDEAVEFP